MQAPVDQDLNVINGAVSRDDPGTVGDLEPVTVCLLSEGHPGHFNQSWGWVRAFSDLRPVRLRWRTVAVGGRGILRRWRLRNLASLRPGGGWRHRLVEAGWTLDPPPAPVDLVVASGHRAAGPALALARDLGAASVYVGPLPVHAVSLFDRVYTADGGTTGPNVTPLSCLPTPLRRADVTAAAAANEAAFGRPLASLLVGARTRSAPFVTRDWDALADLVNGSACRWLLSTSRRTGRGVEDHLRRRVDPDRLADAVWWGRQPRPALPAFYGAPLVCVTSDSLSMASEAFAAGGRVVLLTPAAAGTDADADRYFDRLCESSRVSRLPLGSDVALPSGGPSDTPQDLPEDALRGAIASDWAALLGR